MNKKDVKHKLFFVSVQTKFLWVIKTSSERRGTVVLLDSGRSKNLYINMYWVLYSCFKTVV